MMRKKIKSLFLTAALCIAVLTMTACGSKNLTAENAQALVEEFLQDFKNYKYTDMYALTHDAHPYFQGLYDESVPSKVALFNSLSDEMEYEIRNVEVNKKEAVVNVHISNVDAPAAIDTASKRYVTELMEMGEEAAANADMDKLLSSAITETFGDPETERVEKDTVFNLVVKDGNWTIESNILIYDDITGGYTIPYTWNNLTAVDDK